MTGLLRGLAVIVVSVVLHLALIGRLPLLALSAAMPEPQIRIGADSASVMATAASDEDRAAIAETPAAAAAVVDASSPIAPAAEVASIATEPAGAASGRAAPADSPSASIAGSDAAAQSVTVSSAGSAAPVAGASGAAPVAATAESTAIESPAASGSTQTAEASGVTESAAAQTPPSETAIPSAAARGEPVTATTTSPEAPNTAQSATATTSSGQVASAAAPESEPSTASTVSEPAGAATASPDAAATPVSDGSDQPQVAMLTNPPPDAADHSDAIRAFFEKAGSAPCFIARPQRIGNAGAAAQAYAADAASVAAFETAYHAGIDAGLELTSNVVTAPQCPAIDLIRTTAAGSLAVTLPRTAIPDGDTLTAETEAPPGGALRIFLVDDDGLATDITALAKPEPGLYRVDVPLHATGQGAGKTQLLVALSSDRPLSLLDGAADRPISELMPLIAGEAKVSGAKLRIGLAAFRITE